VTSAKAIHMLHLGATACLLVLLGTASRAQDTDSFLRPTNSHDARQWHIVLSIVVPPPATDQQHWTINVVENKIFLVEPDTSTARANAAAVCRVANSLRWDGSWDVQGFTQGPGEDAATVRDKDADCIVR
jgi:hypothetical protein